MSVTVGFSQANSPLVTGVAPAGAAAPALGTDAGEADLFAMLVAMLAPGATPPPQPVDAPKPKGSAILNVEPTAHPLPSAPAADAPAPTPPADIPPVASQPDSPVPTPAPVSTAPASLDATPVTEVGKTLLKAFGAALRAAQTALQDGKPLDPELEQKLRDTLDAVAAYFGGLPQPTPTAPPTPATEAVAIVRQMAAGLLPTPATDLPPAPPSPDDDAQTADLPEAQQPQPTAPAPTPAAAAPAPAAPAGIAPPAALTPAPAAATAPTAPVAPTDTAPATPTPAQVAVQAKIVPDALAKFGTALADLATQLERQSPDLAATLAKLADRISVGDVPDNVLAELGLSRTADSTTPELEQLAAALTATPPPAKPPATTPAPQQPFAAVALDVLEPLADEPDETKSAKPAPVQAEPPRPEPAKPAPAPAKPDPNQPPAPLQAATAPAPTLDFDAPVDLPADAPAPELKPTAPNAAAATKPTESPPAQPAQPAPQPTTPPAPVATTAPTPSAQPVDAAAPVARAAHAAYQAPIQQVNLPQVAFEVVRQFEAGSSRFQIRLDPPELGRIDVKLDVDKSGTVSARMTVERPETLDLMQRDQRALHQALQQAGLDANKTNLEFSLRQNPFAQQGGLADGQGGNQPRFGGQGGTGTEPSGAEPAPAANLYRGTASAGGVNLFV